MTLSPDKIQSLLYAIQANLTVGKQEDYLEAQYMLFRVSTQIHDYELIYELDMTEIKKLYYKLEKEVALLLKQPQRADTFQRSLQLLTAY